MPTLLPMFLKNFIKKYPKVKLIIEELNTDEIIFKLNNGHLDAAIAATPLNEEKIKEVVLYFEPFVAYIPENHESFSKKEIEISDLNLEVIFTSIAAGRVCKPALLRMVTMCSVIATHKKCDSETS
jgi:LysR family hydrogen peroxide-inducible transcriptional activator